MENRKKYENLEQLRSMIEIPKLFLRYHFNSLRNDIDKVYVQKNKNNNNKEKNQEDFYKTWKEMIERITLIEKECLATVTKNPLSNEIKKEFNDKIKTIRERIFNGENVDSDLLVETNKIKKVLFSNKTITLVKTNSKNLTNDENDCDLSGSEQDSNPRDQSKAKDDLDCKLLIIHNEYVDDQDIEAAMNNRFSKSLTNKGLRLKILAKNLKQINRIHEISLNISNIATLDLSSEAKQFKHTSIELNAFLSFTKLKTLNLAFNNLSSLQENTFEQLSSLENLWLNNNSIIMIHSKSFNGLCSLKWLDLSDNQIVSIDEAIFRELKSLDTLDLENNNIKEIRPFNFQSMPKLKSLYIQNNPFINKLVLDYSSSTSVHSAPVDCTQIFHKNLLKNSKAEQGFSNWSLCSVDNFESNPNVLKKIFKIFKLKSNEAKQDFWKIEMYQSGAYHLLYKEDRSLFKNFVSMHNSSEKFQIIDLLSEGIDEPFFEKYKPDIEIAEHYTARNDCAAEYHLAVYLIDDCLEILEKFSFEDTFQQWSKADWKLVRHRFKYDQSKKTLRYILFYHAGKDTQVMEGFYGCKMTNGFVRILPAGEKLIQNN